MQMLYERQETLGTLRAMIREITEVCQVEVDGLPSAVARVLGRFRDVNTVLEPHQTVPEPGSYTRHILYADPLGRFTVLALVWGAGQHTPVHAHYTWCAYHILQGALQEDRFCLSPSSQEAIFVKTVSRDSGDTSHAHAGYDQIHRLRNNGEETAISIHVYGIDSGRVSTHVNRFV